MEDNDFQRLSKAPEYTSAATTDASSLKVEHETAVTLSAEHQEYLLRRHGTLDLDPLPTMDDADPYNWPTWKKCVNLALVAFHAMMALYTAAAIQTFLLDISITLHTSIQRSSYLVTSFVAVTGVAPFLWRPLAHRYGRRPVLLLSLVLSAVGNIGCARSPTFSIMAVCRAVTAFFICPAAAIGSAVVAETFFKQYRARAIGVWTILVTVGSPLASLTMGPVGNVTASAGLPGSYRWIYWILAVINGIQFVLYGLFGPETRYLRDGSESAPKKDTPQRMQYISFHRIDPTPLTAKDFVGPFLLVIRPCVALPAAIYAMTFLVVVLTSIMIPQIYPLPPFNLDTVQLGLVNVSFIVGALLGEQIGGFISDRWMLRPATRPPPEYRLWLGYIGHACTICGLVVFLIQTHHATSWNVTPFIGSAIAWGGAQIVTTIFITYAVDKHPEDADSVGVLVTFARQTWGFIGPFYFPQMIANTGYGGACGIMIAMLFLVSILPTMLLQWKGGKWR